MTITTAGTAVHLAPTVTKTFFKHYYKKAKRSLKSRSRNASTTDPHDRMNARDEFMFDEAFNIVKSFINFGTSDTVEAIQNFTDAPAPPIPWATTLPVMIPMESCDKAAELIIEHLGEKDLSKLVGGEKWWQLRSLPGLQGEWIAMSNDWKKMKSMECKQAQQGPSEGAAAASKKAAQTRRRRNKRHERARSEIRAMRQKTESAIKRRSQSFKRTSQDRDNARAAAAAAAAEADQANNDTASAVDTEDEVPQPNIDAADLSPETDAEDDDERAAEQEELDRLQRVMLYFHGGGYYFGSLATHRYQIVRYARKFGGKCFAPIYRKAPQYPWPCALQDAVASYLFLIDPPKGAKHKAVDPKKIVVAGDSAGGGLTLALLTVIRDMGLPAPAGAVLISPWCDLTHSFSSILQNTATDIIPPYGFIHKPSTLWPINATKPVKEEKSNEVGNKEDEEGEPRRKVPVGVEEEGEDSEKKESDDTEPAARKSIDGGRLQSTATNTDTDIKRRPKEASSSSKLDDGVPPAPDLLWSDPISIRRSDSSKQDIELQEQIQLYATNDQLTHPLCSAVLSGSLGGLPPLFILAGDAEVLRDEIVYLAHRAAHPSRYPLRKGLLDHSQRSRENAEQYDSQPTKVHLQIYDQMCHVLTAFAFTSQSRFAYRAVASFVKHVTGAPTNIKNPFPAVEGEGEHGDGEDGEWEEGHGGGTTAVGEADDGISDNVGGEVVSPPLASSLQSSQASMNVPDGNGAVEKALNMTPSSSSSGSGGANGSGSGGLTALKSIDSNSGGGNKPNTSSTDSNPIHAEPESIDQPPNATSDPTVTKTRHRSMSKVLADTLHGHPSGSSSHSATADPITGPRRGTSDVANEYTGQVPLLRPSFQSFMIRERVDVRGYLRPLEHETSLPALQINPEEIGCIKEGPVERYLDGQTQWAKRFAKTARKVEKQRAKNEQLAHKMLAEAASQGLMDLEGLERKKRELMRKANTPDAEFNAADGSGKSLGLSADDVAAGAEKCREKWFWLCDFGPMDLVNETPPPAAIAGRRDTEDALILLRRSFQIRALAYGIQRKSRFWGAEDKPVRAHLRAATGTELDTKTSTDPTGETVDGEGEKSKKHHHHHRGLGVWNLLMVKKPPTAGKAK
ncbi:uncharacterized protein UHOD_02664 [Ustilago sp. UG-2017b]|nr:uncharacterized protein UHOD_02664 [Ustilago sp. UG-2017b]